jgi:hypothetical protein
VCTVRVCAETFFLLSWSSCVRNALALDSPVKEHLDESVRESK